MNDLELYHYGVKGMKWGVRKADRKLSTNERLEEKAHKYDIKAAKFKKKSERAHSRLDLHRANFPARRAAKLSKKAASIAKDALRESDDIQRLHMYAKSEDLKFKASKAQIRANRIAKKKGYGFIAMHYSIKSDRAVTKAAKARRTIAKNEAYISMMNKQTSDLSSDKIELGREFITGREEA